MIKLYKPVLGEGIKEWLYDRNQTSSLSSLWFTSAVDDLWSVTEGYFSWTLKCPHLTHTFHFVGEVTSHYTIPILFQSVGFSFLAHFPHWSLAFILTAESDGCEFLLVLEFNDLHQFQASIRIKNCKSSLWLLFVAHPLCKKVIQSLEKSNYKSLRRKETPWQKTNSVCDLSSAFHWLLQAHLTSGRYNWQPVVHVITDQVTDTFEAMVFGTNLQRETKEGARVN